MVDKDPVAGAHGPDRLKSLRTFNAVPGRSLVAFEVGDGIDLRFRFGQEVIHYVYLNEARTNSPLKPDSNRYKNECGTMANSQFFDAPS